MKERLSNTTNKIKANIHSLKEKKKWFSNYMFLKHPFILSRFFNITIQLLFLLITALLFFFFLYKLDFINIVNKHIVWNHFVKISDKVNLTSIITTQISISFLVVSISSLIANVENKYFFGENAITLLFNRFGFYSFGLFLFTLVLLSFLNIYLLIKHSSESSIITIFLFSLILIAGMVLRLARLFLDSENIKKGILIKYYKSNVKSIKKSKPIEVQESLSLQKLLEKTILSIQTGDSKVYDNNINAYLDITKITLFNHKELVQEYYTEGLFHSDSIAHLGIIAEELDKSNHSMQSIYLYNRIYELLNYFEVINVSNHKLYNNSIKMIARLKYINNESLANTYFENLTSLIEKQFYQVFLFTSVDLSYCRLAKKELILYHPYNDHMEKLYTSINENKVLLESDKEKLYDELSLFSRMIEFTEKHPPKTVEDFRNRIIIHKSHNEYPVQIIAEPFALMILKMFENNDEQNIKRFLKIGLSTRLSNAIKAFVFLPIIQILYRENKRQYVLDLNINADFTINTIRNNGLFVFENDLKEMLNLYYLLADKYVIKKSDYVEGSYYGFYPKFRFSQEVLDTVFLFVMSVNKTEDEFKSSIKNKNIAINHDVMEIINRLIKSESVSLTDS